MMRILLGLPWLYKYNLFPPDGLWPFFLPSFLQLCDVYVQAVDSCRWSTDEILYNYIALQKATCTPVHYEIEISWQWLTLIITHIYYFSFSISFIGLFPTFLTLMRLPHTVIVRCVFASTTSWRLWSEFRDIFISDTLALFYLQHKQTKVCLCGTKFVYQSKFRWFSSTYL